MSSCFPEGFSFRRGGLEDVTRVTEALIAEEAAVRGESLWAGTHVRDQDVTFEKVLG